MSVSQAEHPGLIMAITDKDFPSIRCAGPCTQLSRSRYACFCHYLSVFHMHEDQHSCIHEDDMTPLTTCIRTPIIMRGNREHASSAASIPMHSYVRLRKKQPFPHSMWARQAVDSLLNLPSLTREICGRPGHPCPLTKSVVLSVRQARHA